MKCIWSGNYTIHGVLIHITFSLPAPYCFDVSQNKNNNVIMSQNNPM